MSEYPLPNWISDAIFYQIFPERFCNGDLTNDPPHTTSWDDLPTRDNFFGGDLQGILNRLDYLQDLGINAIYLNPIFKARTNHKYDTEDYFQVDPAFGTNDQLRQLVKEIHRRNMHIILDGVFNHCGFEFPGFQDLINHGKNSSFRDWFQVRSFPICTEPVSYMTCGGAEYLPKFNHAHRPVQEFILRVGRYWIEAFDIDGWRLDVPFKIPFEFWKEFRYEIRKANPQAYLLGEVWRDARPWIKGDIFDGITNYRLRDLLLDYCLAHILDGEDFSFETRLLAESHGKSIAGMANLLDSHDTPRILTSLRGDINALAIALTYVMTTPGVPMIFYGDEVGMIGEADPDCRRPMQWRQEMWDLRIFNLYRRLIQLRKDHPALRHGNRTDVFSFNGVFAYKMSYNDDEVMIILNPREEISGVSLKINSPSGVWRDSQSGKDYPAIEGILEIAKIPANSAIILLPAP